MSKAKQQPRRTWNYYKGRLFETFIFYHYFKMSPRFWLGLQMDYDLGIEEDKLSKRLEKEVSIYKRAHELT
ncbi:MAG: hypothetical protein GY777_16175 [Candidatus Brocadiaceae bacterium]|nr:hypothetical protein [Candidatus Brocadiaceae bacterium]